MGPLKWTGRVSHAWGKRNHNFGAGNYRPLAARAEWIRHAWGKKGITILVLARVEWFRRAWGKKESILVRALGAPGTGGVGQVCMGKKESILVRAPRGPWHGQGGSGVHEENGINFGVGPSGPLVQAGWVSRAWGKKGITILVRAPRGPWHGRGGSGMHGGKGITILVLGPRGPWHRRGG
mgnify:CR=1 FL=1